MPQSLFFLLGIIFTSGIVLGSEGKRDKIGSGKERKHRALSEGSSSNGSNKGRDYADMVLSQVAFDAATVERDGVIIPKIRQQTSSNSLSEYAEEPGTPDQKVKGLYDDMSGRIGIVYKNTKTAPTNKKAVLPEGYFDEADEERGREEASRRRRHSEASSSSKKSKPSAGNSGK